jgi:hypothetical protein
MPRQSQKMALAVLIFSEGFACNNFVISSTFNWVAVISVFPLTITNVRSNILARNQMSLTATIHNTESIAIQFGTFFEVD